MGGTRDNNSSFLKILFSILFSFVKLKVVLIANFADLTLRTSWALKPSTSVAYVPFRTLQV